MHLTVFSANKMLDFTWATATQNTSAKIHRYIAESSLRKFYKRMQITQITVWLSRRKTVLFCKITSRVRRISISSFCTSSDSDSLCWSSAVCRSVISLGSVACRRLYTEIRKRLHIAAVGRVVPVRLSPGQSFDYYRIRSNNLLCGCVTKWLWLTERQRKGEQWQAMSLGAPPLAVSMTTYTDIK